MEYAFDSTKPPLLKDFPDIRNVPEASLSNKIGSENYPETKEESVTVQPYGQKWTFKRISNIKVTREQRWAISDGPIHYAEDTTFNRTVRRGYTEEQKSNFEKTIEVESSYGVEKVFKFNATVKAGLKISDDISRTWVLEETSSIEQVFKANNTYIFWNLYDVFTAVRDTITEIYLGDKLVGTKPPEHSESSFSSIINTYQDRKNDNEMAIVDAFIRSGYGPLA